MSGYHPPGRPDVTITPRIIGGTNETRPVPWMVSLRDSYGFHYCGGTLIADAWVLTAAHCVMAYDTTYDQAWVGGLTLNKRSEWSILSMEQLFCHPNFDSVMLTNDICLVKLGGKVPPPVYATPDEAVHQYIILNSYPENEIPGEIETISGWGVTAEKGVAMSKSLQTVPVQIADFAACDEEFDHVQASYQICTGDGTGRHDSCQGDSGGPLYVSDKDRPAFVFQVGVVSWGKGCGRGGSYSVNIKVSAYRDWIYKTIEQAAPGTEVGGIPIEKPTSMIGVYVGVGVGLAVLGIAAISIGIWLYIRAHKEELQERMRRASDAAMYMFSEARRRSSQSLHNLRHNSLFFRDFAERRRRRTEDVLRSWSAGDLWALTKLDEEDEEEAPVKKNSVVGDASTRSGSLPTSQFLNPGSLAVSEHLNALDLAGDIDVVLSRRVSQQIEMAVLNAETSPHDDDHFEFDMEEYEIPKFFQVAMKD